MRCLLFSIAVFGLLLTPTSTPAKIAFIPLDQLVAQADFIGLVECEIAGATVAKYKVLDSVRGAKAGEHIHIRTFVRGVGPQFRISLAGERYLAIAVRAAPYEQWSRMGSGVPIAWRRLHADYDVPYGQGPSPLTPDATQRYADAKKLAAAQLKGEFKLPPPGANPIWSAPPQPRPTDAQIDAWRKILAGGKSPLKSDDAAKAKEGLYAYAPTPFFEKLITETPLELKPGVRYPESLYATASYAAWKCGQDREKHLKMLLAAKEPIVRVTGAVYLCFENEKLGKEELAKLTKLDEEPGAWAALTLARRGDKNAVPRVIDFFKPHAGIAKTSLIEVNLKLTAQVLLSNSAQMSGVPQPPRAAANRPWGHEVDFDALQAWWQQHSAKITLHDPWLETLSKQKID